MTMGRKKLSKNGNPPPVKRDHLLNIKLQLDMSVFFELIFMEQYILLRSEEFI